PRHLPSFPTRRSSDLQPVVAVADQFGNVRSEENCDGPCGTAPVVTAARSAGSGTLQGTTSLTTVDGVVTFTNLSHNVASTITIQDRKSTRLNSSHLGI